jgi:hypothetical protein
MGKGWNSLAHDTSSTKDEGITIISDNDVDDAQFVES